MTLVLFTSQFLIFFCVKRIRCLKSLIFQLKSGMSLEDEIRSSTGDDYTEITSTYVNGEPCYDNFHKASHVMLYSPSNRTVLDGEYHSKAAVHMQFRFDGHFGFPGGMIDSGETPVEAVNRELTEESGYENDQLKIKETDLKAIHVSDKKKLILFFFVKQIPLEILSQLEKSYVNHEVWGDEAMGTIRVPLFTMTDGFCGFPAFLTSPFIGNCKQQLILGLRLAKILNEEELRKALSAKPKNTFLL